MLELVQEPKYIAKIKMIGVGGAGCNTVNYAQRSHSRCGHGFYYVW